MNVVRCTRFEFARLLHRERRKFPSTKNAKRGCLIETVALVLIDVTHNVAISLRDKVGEQNARRQQKRNLLAIQRVKLLSLQNALEAFLEDPSADGFLRVRRMLIAEGDYRPRWQAVRRLSQLAEEQQHDQLLAEVDELMPAWVLCPRIHFLAGIAAEALGDAEEVELRRFLTQSCLAGLLATGPGSRTQPLLATYPTDVQDALAGMRQTACSQRLVKDGQRLLDVITCKDKQAVWFDVTQLVQHGSHRPELVVAGKTPLRRFSF